MERARAPLLPALVRRRAEPRGACRLLGPVPPRDRRARPPQRRRRRLRSRLRALRAAPPRRGGGLPHRPLGRLRRGGRRRGRRRAHARRRSASTPGPATTTGVSQLVRLYAIESGQPAISKTKREGLAAHYGIGDGPGNEYFRVHEEADVDHAAEGRSLIEAHLADADPDALVAAAESVFKANWRLLDGVTRRRRLARIALAFRDRGGDRRVSSRCRRSCCSGRSCSATTRAATRSSASPSGSPRARPPGRSRLELRRVAPSRPVPSPPAAAC